MESARVHGREGANLQGADRVMDALNQAIDHSLANVPKFEGSTLIALDSSGSMAGRPQTIGSLFAAVLVKAGGADLMVFSDDARYVTLNRRDTTLTAANSIPFAAGGTNFNAIFERANRAYDRIVILSDMQGWMGGGAPVQPFAAYQQRYHVAPRVFSFDLKGNGTLQFSAQREALAGQMAEIHAAGKVEVYSETQVMERLAQAEDAGRELVAAFSRVRELFHEAVRTIAAKQAEAGVTRGAILEHAIQQDDYLKSTPEGQSFYIFWQFLLSSRGDNEITRLAEKLYDRPGLPPAQRERRLLMTLPHTLLEEGRNVVDVNGRMSRQLMARVARHYETNLAPLALGQTPFPLRFERLGAPTARTPLAEWREWSEEIARGAAGGTGRGYTVEYARREFRSLGEQQVPVAVIFPTEADLLARLGKTTELSALRTDLSLIAAKVPALKTWAETNIRQVRDWHADWANLLEVVSFFLAHPYPRIYPREVPIAIADKFIEQHRPQLRELLDAVLPPSLVVASEDFHQRFGLKSMPQLVRVRLPQDLKLAGLSAGDISLRLDEWSAVQLSPRVVLVVENLTTFLALPLRPGIPLVWGSGWGAVSLSDISWIRGAEVIYWGDVDPTGFAILASLRSRHASTRSVMMDSSHAQLPRSPNHPLRILGGSSSEGFGQVCLRGAELHVRFRVEA